MVAKLNKIEWDGEEVRKAQMYVSKQKQTKATHFMQIMQGE